MTSAPRFARSCVAYGPGKRRERSRMRIPARDGIETPCIQWFTLYPNLCQARLYHIFTKSVPKNGLTWTIPTPSTGGDRKPPSPDHCDGGFLLSGVHTQSRGQPPAVEEGICP